MVGVGWEGTKLTPALRDWCPNGTVDMIAALRTPANARSAARSSRVPGMALLPLPILRVPS